MLLAQEKKKTNIIEYLLLIYQMEDLVRSVNMNIDVLVNKFIAPHISDNKLVEDYKVWYEEIIDDLLVFKREKQGHISDVYEIQMELFYLHNSLLTISSNESYIQIYSDVQPFINEFRDKTPIHLNDIDLCIYALYMKLQLRLQGKTISEETEKAFDAMRKLLTSLAKAYHKMKAGDVAFYLN
jgi:hypothetical protein